MWLSDGLLLVGSHGGCLRGNFEEVKILMEDKSFRKREGVVPSCSKELKYRMNNQRKEKA